MEYVALLKSVEATVNGGKAVISADSSTIIAIVQDAISSGTPATFYLSRAQGQAVHRWYWTPRRIDEIGYKPIPTEERVKIESQLGIKCAGTWYSNRIECPTCQSVYGMFEFMQQGLREHDRDWIKAVLELENTSVLRANQALDSFCANCNELLLAGHYYGMYTFPGGGAIYGCCRA